MIAVKYKIKIYIDVLLVKKCLEGGKVVFRLEK